MVCSRYTTKKTVKKPAKKTVRKTTTVTKKVVRKTTTRKTAPRKTTVKNPPLFKGYHAKRIYLFEAEKPFVEKDVKNYLSIDYMTPTKRQMGQEWDKTTWSIARKKKDKWFLRGEYDEYDDDDGYRTTAEVLSMMNKERAKVRRAYLKNPSNPKTKRHHLSIGYYVE